MSINELISAVQALPRADKLRLIQQIAAQLEHEEPHVSELPAIVEVWSPYDSFDAAAALAQVLAEDKASE